MEDRTASLPGNPMRHNVVPAHNNHKQGAKLRSANLRFALITLPQISSTTFGPCCGR